MQNQNQSRFSALGADCVYLLRVLVGFVRLRWLWLATVIALVSVLEVSWLRAKSETSGFFVKLLALLVHVFRYAFFLLFWRIRVEPIFVVFFLHTNICSWFLRHHALNTVNTTHNTFWHCRIHGRNNCIAIFLVTSPIVINVPTRELLAVETKSSFV